MDAAHQQQFLADLVVMRASYVARVRRWPGARDVAEDLVQEAFTRAVFAVGGIRDDASKDEWFFRVLRSAYVDYRRRRDVRRRLRAAASADALVERQVTPDQMEPESTKANCACLRRGLASLRPEYRRALEVVVLGERSHGELAEIARISRTNAGVRVHRARGALRRLLRACRTGCCGDDACCCARSGQRASASA